MFNIAAESIGKDLAVNVLSPYVAAQSAVRGWATLPPEMKKTFIYTGNAANVSVAPFPMPMTLGIGKAGAAYWVGLADVVHKGEFVFRRECWLSLC